MRVKTVIIKVKDNRLLIINLPAMPNPLAQQFLPTMTSTNTTFTFKTSTFISRGKSHSQTAIYNSSTITYHSTINQHWSTKGKLTAKLLLSMILIIIIIMIIICSIRIDRCSPRSRWGMDLEWTYGRTAWPTWANGSMIKCKDKAKYGMQMETYIQESSWRVKQMDKAPIRLLMVYTLKDNMLTIT